MIQIKYCDRGECEEIHVDDKCEWCTQIHDEEFDEWFVDHLLRIGGLDD